MAEEIKKEKNQEPKQETPKKLLVTSDRDVDFPSLGWGISAGMTKELPVDESSQKIILANYNIKLIK